MKTVNGGNTWDSIYSNPGSNITFKNIEFINNLTGFVVGGSSVLRTTNSGQNWNQSPISIEIEDIEFINDSTGFLVGHSGKFFKTTNSGNTWSAISISVFYLHTLTCIDFINQNTGYIGCKSEGFPLDPLFKTTDGGNSWIRWTITPSSVGYRACSFINADTGFFISGNGIVVKTTNGGNNWFTSASLQKIPNDIYAVDYNNIYMTTDGNCIYKSVDGGTIWIEQPYSNSPAGLFGIYMLNSQTGYAVGENGLIVKTTNGGGTVGIEPAGNEIPGVFRLYQNYPNPFNPETTIPFDIPYGTHVKLKVYDLLGREVAVLVNSRLEAGTYQYNWNGGSFSSGMYLYRFETPGYIVTKKMTLIK